MTKPKVALIRGQFLNQFDLQSYEPLKEKYDFTAFGSKHPIHQRVPFETVLLPSFTDLPSFPKKMPLLNRLTVDANYLFGLEEKLKGFDIAHTAETYYHYTQQAIRAKEKGYVKRVVTTVWENIPHNNEGIRGRMRYKKQAREEVDHFVAVTKVAKQALVAEGTDPKKISVIAPGIDTRKFFPEKGHFEKLGKKKKEITILFVGRLEEYKGVMDILEAAVLLEHDQSLKSYIINYIFVGTGSKKEQMKQFAKVYDLENQIMYMTAEYVSIPEVYTMADIFVAPSKNDTYWKEQYGMMLLEAQASGLPIVTTKSGGIPENVGDGAFLVEPGNVEAIARALKKFILSPNLRVEYAKKARARAEKVHDIQIVAKQIDQVYKKVLAV